MLRRNIKIPAPLIGLAFGLASGLAVAGCSSLSNLPESVGGLPADAPAQPEAPYQYPAVHDLPPPRATQPMSDEEQQRAENALKAARDRQEKKLEKER